MNLLTSIIYPRISTMISSSLAVLKTIISESIGSSFIKGDINVRSERFMGQSIYSAKLVRHEINPKFIGDFSQSNESKKVPGNPVS